MRVGSFVFATEQGLGFLAKDFFDHGVVTDPIILRHGRRADHFDWYPEGTMILGTRPFLNDTTKQIIREMDAMLFFETPFDWETITFCRDVGVKTALMPMHECMPAELPAVPDVFVCPSALDLDVYGGVFIPVPVPAWVEWRERGRAITFVHNAGHGGLMGRNGTSELVSALPFITSPIKLILRSQDTDITKEMQNIAASSNVQVELDTQYILDQAELYREGDVFVFPEKFNGLSLPLQEAYASGMLVMCTDRFPMNTWLPTGPMIPPYNNYRRSRVSSGTRIFLESVINPRLIASTIDSWYGKDVSLFSWMGREWADDHSWDVLKPKYLDVLSK
jgi:glycosyltransferase involved in cell wall biosynthesis